MATIKEILDASPIAAQRQFYEACRRSGFFRSTVTSIAGVIGTTVEALEFGQAGSAGSTGLVSDAGHEHAMPADPRIEARKRSWF